MSKQNNVYTFLAYIHLPIGISCYPLFDNVFTSYRSYNRVSLYTAVTVVNDHSLIILGNHIAPTLERERDTERGGTMFNDVIPPYNMFHDVFLSYITISHRGTSIPDKSFTLYLPSFSSFGCT